MIDETVQGMHVIALGTQGFRHMYGKKEIHKVEDMKGLKVRVQATATEDTMFPAYGAQTVHMPFGSVYTSLQTGVVDFAENGVNVYLVNKHYEVAPVLSMTEHEANNAIMLGQRQALAEPHRRAEAMGAGGGRRGQPEGAGKGVRAGAPVGRQAGEDGRQDRHRRRQDRLQKIADPYLDKLAKELGPHADKIKDLIRAIN